jgi:hypothetical protein
MSIEAPPGAGLHHSEPPLGAYFKMPFSGRALKKLENYRLFRLSQFP